MNAVYDKDKSDGANLAAMTREIYRQGPSKVSRHCASCIDENVCDIVPSSNGKSFYSHVRQDSRVTKYLCPYNDSGENCHHLQIKQP